MTFTKFETFKKQVGLIESPDQLARFGAPLPAHDNGMYETGQRTTLNEFLESHPDFHVATLVDAENLFVIQNCPRLINRLGFFLCNGDKNPDLVLEEKEVSYEIK